MVYAIILNIFCFLNQYSYRKVYFQYWYILRRINPRRCKNVRSQMFYSFLFSKISVSECPFTIGSYKHSSTLHFYIDETLSYLLLKLDGVNINIPI